MGLIAKDCLLQIVAQKHLTPRNKMAGARLAMLVMAH
jgi:hypothetical protein